MIDTEPDGGTLGIDDPTAPPGPALDLRIVGVGGCHVEGLWLAGGGRRVLGEAVVGLA